MQGGRCIWKSTTYKRDRKVGRDLDASAAAAARRHGWLLMDAWAATQAAKMEQLPSDPYVDTVRVFLLVTCMQCFELVNPRELSVEGSSAKLLAPCTARHCLSLFVGFPSASGLPMCAQVAT